MSDYETTETVVVGRRWVLPNRELMGGDSDRDEIVIAGPTTEPPPEPVGWYPAQIYVGLDEFRDADAYHPDERASHGDE